MGRLRAALLASVAALAVAAGTPAAATAAPSAAPKAVTKYFALDGSASHLLYAAKKTAKAFDGSGGTRYVLDDRKHRITVPKGYSAYLVGDEPLFRKEVVVPQDGITDVLWIRPEQGTSGRWSLPEASSIVAPAPNGWIIATPVEGGTDGRQAVGLRRVTTDGRMTDLGVPRPDGEYFSVQAAPAGLLISDPTDGGDAASAGTLQSMPWSKPGTYTQIYPATGTSPAIGTPISCGEASRTQVRCTVGMDEDTRVRLIPLDGSKSKVVDERCALYPTVRSAAVAWIDRTSTNGCKAGRVEQRTNAGRLTASTRRYYRLQDPVSAFGKLVVATSTQRHLVTISTPASTPKQIVGG